VFLELTYTQLLFSLMEPHALSLVRRNFRGCSLTVPAVFVIMHMRDDGMLPDRVPGLQV